MNNETSYFLFQIISFDKYFYVSLGNNFLTVFVEVPLVVEALGSCPVCPPLNPALAFEFRRGSLTRLHQTAVIVISMDSRQVRLVVKVGHVTLPFLTDRTQATKPYSDCDARDDEIWQKSLPVRE